PAECNSAIECNSALRSLTIAPTIPLASPMDSSCRPLQRSKCAASQHFLFSRKTFCAIVCSVQLLSPDEIRRVAQLALAEDVGSGDATTLATIGEADTASARMRAREPLVVAGLPIVEAV